jgi:hypothetical protein
VLYRLVEDSGFERFDVGDDVRQFRHQAILAERFSGSALISTRAFQARCLQFARYGLDLSVSLTGHPSRQLRNCPNSLANLSGMHFD